MHYEDPHAMSKGRTAMHRPAFRRPPPAKPRLILLNKPYGVLTQFSGEPEDRTLKQYVDVPDVYPAGRLDKDSEGLLLLTNDGRLQATISDPAHKLGKTYYVLVEGKPDSAALNALSQGVELKDGMTRPAEAKLIEEPDWLWSREPPVRTRQTIQDYWLQLTIFEGRNRQVRRMTAHVGHPTLRLIRYQVGPWTLQGLNSGQWQDADIPENLRPKRQSSPAKRPYSMAPKPKK